MAVQAADGSSCRAQIYVPVAPDLWHMCRPPIRIVVEDGIWGAIEAFIKTVLPEFGAVRVWMCDAHKSQHGHGQGQFHEQKHHEELGHAPLFRQYDHFHLTS